jgi:uncharacterized membrane protein
MSDLLRIFRDQFLYVRNSIAFFPAIIAVGLMLVGGILILLEEKFIARDTIENLPFLIINDADTARSILNTMIGGIISLMVFSFSMVMILLNQASSNFSPRLLPGLITNKRHQIVLGIYLGAILFLILCSINVLPGNEKGVANIPSLSILTGIILSIVCLGMFIYFIHSISESIQISNIIKRLYEDGKADIERLKGEVANTPNHDLPLIHEVHSDRHGYLISDSIESIQRMAEEKDFHIDLIQPIGLFLKEGEITFKISRPLSKEDEEKLLNCLDFSVNESVNSSHFSTIKNITEVALKAMSPGINDPGTALLAINYLTLLLAERMQLLDKIYYESKDDDNKKTGRVSRLLMPFKQLIFNTVGELRTYVAHDQLVVSKIIDSLDYLLTKPAATDEFYQIIEMERNIFVKVSKKELQSDYDIKNILK